MRLSLGHGLSSRQVARSCRIARSTVGEYLRRAQEAGLSWPLPEGLDDGQLEQRLFPPAPEIPTESRPVPDWATIHRELRKKSVTLFLLWQEYRERYREGFGYSWFCDHYRAWAGKVDVVMRQAHRAGEKLFVDYAGQTVPVIDPATGEIREAQIFVGTLGASNYTYAEATWTQALPDWIGSHVRAFRFLGCVSEIVVPDNVKCGVTHPHLYEPDRNPTYVHAMEYHDTVVVPARSGKPRDKAKVEAGVQVVERWILARLRHQTFFSLTELNRAIRALLKNLNERPFKKLPGNRRQAFEQIDRPAMRPLPAVAYEYTEWGKGRVHIDYHVEIDKHYYSVPYQLVGLQLDFSLTLRTVEIFHKHQRVTSHVRSFVKGRHTTLPEHMPKSHRAHAEWTPQRLVKWARETGPATAVVVKKIMASRRHPQHGFRPCLGIMRLGKTYGSGRLEAACRRAHALEAYGYRHIEGILKNELDRRPLPQKTAPQSKIEHANVRGANYYAAADPVEQP
jgi:transposase